MDGPHHNTIFVYYRVLIGILHVLVYQLTDGSDVY